LQFAANREGVIRPTALVGRPGPDWLTGSGPAVPHGPPHRRKWRVVGHPLRFLVWVEKRGNFGPEVCREPCIFVG